MASAQHEIRNEQKRSAEQHRAHIPLLAGSARRSRRNEFGRCRKHGAAFTTKPIDQAREAHGPELYSISARFAAAGAPLASWDVSGAPAQVLHVRSEFGVRDAVADDAVREGGSNLNSSLTPL